MLSSSSLLSLASILTIDLCVGSEWELLSTGPWYAREGLMGVVYNGYIYMAGGRQDTLFFNDVYRLNGSCNSAGSGDCAWQLLTDSAAWSERGYHIMIEHADYMYVIGGQNYTSFYNDVWRSQDGINWEQVLSNNYINASQRADSTQFEQRAGLAAISYKNETIFVMGGCLNNPPARILYNDVWTSQDDGKTWSLLIDSSGWRPRSGARVQILEDTMYLAAGEFGFSSPTQYDDVWKLDLTQFESFKSVKTVEADSWELVTKKPGWEKRSGHGFIIDSDGTFWIIAGYFDKHDLWKSQDQGQTWNMTRNDVFDCTDTKCGRYDFWSVIYERYLIIYGGDGDYSTFGGEYNETWRLDLS